MLELFIQNNILCHAIEAMAFASIGCALLSVIITQMRISTIGFTMSHAAFAGSAIGAFIDLNTTVSALIASIIVAGILGPLSERTRMPTDTTLGVLFGLLMAIAIFFVSLMQNQMRGYSTFALLFGNVISLYREEIYSLLVITIITIIFILLFSKEISAIIFHKRIAEVTGIHVKPVYYGILGMIAVMIALILPIVGGLLVYVWLITPAATVFQFCKTLKGMFIMAPVIAGTLSVIGAYIGIQYNFPVGPLTAMFFGGIFVLAVLVSPRRKISIHNN